MSNNRFNTDLLKIKGFTENADGTFSKKPIDISPLPIQTQVQILHLLNDSGIKLSGSKLELNVTPCPAPRMTQSDVWRTPNHKDERKRQRPCVTRYFAFRDTFIAECKRVGYSLGSEVNVEFYLPMPASWSKKKKVEMDGKPHQQRPDIDNITKSTFDAFGADDSFVWSITAKKYWSTTGKIIFNK